MSPRTLAEHGIEWDEDGAPIGYQIGRAAAIQEWRWRKEQNDKDFQRLCWRLKINRWRTSNRVKARETARERRKARIASDPNFLALDSAKRRKRNQPKLIARRAGITYTCTREGCGKTWPQPLDEPIRRRKPLYCSGACAQRAYRARRNADPVKGPIARERTNSENRRRKAARQAKMKECNP